MKYRRHSHSITNMNFHIILCSKYRKAYFHKIKSRHLLSCFRNSCVKNGCALAECEIMPDHIHMFVSVMKPVRFQLHKLIHHLKGYSSYTIRKANPWMKLYKAFWSSSYFSESIGNISESTIRKYIRNQKVNVKSGYKFKSLVEFQVKRRTRCIEYEEEEKKIKHSKNKTQLHSGKKKQCSLSSFQNTNKNCKEPIQQWSFRKKTIL